MVIRKSTLEVNTPEGRKFLSPNPRQEWHHAASAAGTPHRERDHSACGTITVGPISNTSPPDCSWREAWLGCIFAENFILQCERATSQRPKSVDPKAQPQDRDSDRSDCRIAIDYGGRLLKRGSYSGSHFRSCCGSANILLSMCDSAWRSQPTTQFSYRYIPDRPDRTRMGWRNAPDRSKTGEYSSGIEALQ